MIFFNVNVATSFWWFIGVRGSIFFAGSGASNLKTQISSWRHIKDSHLILPLALKFRISTSEPQLFKKPVQIVKNFWYEFRDSPPNVMSVQAQITNFWNLDLRSRHTNANLVSPKHFRKWTYEVVGVVMGSQVAIETFLCTYKISRVNLTFRKIQRSTHLPSSRKDYSSRK